MMTQLLLISAAGGAGAMLRFVADEFLFTKTSKRWRLPLAQISVNATGSFLAGLVAGLAVSALSEPVATVILTGFLGGFTTLSAASVHTARLVRARKWVPAMVVGAGQLILSVAAAFLGASLTFE